MSVLRTLLVTAVLVMSVLGPASPAMAARSCGTIGSGLERLYVRVVSGPVGCKEARKVVRLAMRDADGRIGKWRCDGGAGGFGCLKSSPRARLTATIQ